MGEEPEDRKGIAMGFPRDYYRDEYGEPSLHSLHGSRPYVERDNLADMAHDQLPTLSTIGAGPQGAGVIPVPVVGEPGSYRFQLVSDETGEVLLTSDNLHPGEISVWSPAHEWVAGEAETVYIRVRKGDEVDEYPIEIPPGAVGSRWFVGPEAEYSSSNVYYFQVGDLQYDGLNAYRGKPVPRPNDLCAFRSGHDLVLGNVDACEAGTVVVVARTYIPVPVPEIGENGNWMVDGVDTGQPSKGDRGDDGLNAVVRIGNVEALPPGKASATMNVDVEKNVYTLNLGIPEGAPGKAIDIQGGIWTTDTLPDYDNTEVNTAFIVHDNDKQFDLYIRGRIPVTASDGGPWTVVEDWQGRPGTGPHMLKKPYVLGRSEGSIVRVPAAELSLAFAPYDHMSDGDVVIDTEMSVGILGSTEDDSGDYTVETMGTVTARWENVEGKPFDTVLDGDGLVVTEASMDGEVIGKVLNMDPDSLSPKWDMVREKPSSFPAKVDSDDRLLSVDVDGVLKSGNVEWSTIVGKPSTYPHDEVRWDEVTGKPESFGIQVACTAVAEPSKKWLVQGDGDAWELGANVELEKAPDNIPSQYETFGSANQSSTRGKGGTVSAGLSSLGWPSALSSFVYNSVPEAIRDVPTSIVSLLDEKPSSKSLLGVTVDTNDVEQVLVLSLPDSGTNNYYANVFSIPEKYRNSGRVAMSYNKSVTKMSPRASTTHSGISLSVGTGNPQIMESASDYMADLAKPVKSDALLTTDAIERSEPADLSVYDDGGKLKVSEAAVTALIPEAPSGGSSWNAVYPQAIIEPRCALRQNADLANLGASISLYVKFVLPDGTLVPSSYPANPESLDPALAAMLSEYNMSLQIRSFDSPLCTVPLVPELFFDPNVEHHYSNIYINQKIGADGTIVTAIGNGSVDTGDESKRINCDEIPEGPLTANIVLRTNDEAAEFVGIMGMAQMYCGDMQKTPQALVRWNVANNALVINGRIPGYKTDWFPWGLVCEVGGKRNSQWLSYPNYAAIPVPVTGETFTLTLDLSQFSDTSTPPVAIEPDFVDITLCAGCPGASSQTVANPKRVLYEGTLPIVRPITKAYIESLLNG